MARSKINDRAGARTQLAGFVSGVIALLAIFFLLPYFYYLPKAVLSSIIFIAVLSLLVEAPEDIEFMWRIHAWRDFSLLCATFLATVVVSIEAGTLLAVSLSLLLTVKETSYPRITIMVMYREGRGKGAEELFYVLSGCVFHREKQRCKRLKQLTDSPHGSLSGYLC